MGKKGGNHNENLVVPTSEQARKNGRAGGIASARARQERKSMRETVEILLKMPMKNGKIDNINGIESLSEIAKDQGHNVNLTLQDMMLVATMRKAMKGDIRATEMIMQLVGESQAEAQSVSPLDNLAMTIEKYKDEDDD